MPYASPRSPTSSSTRSSTPRPNSSARSASPPSSPLMALESACIPIPSEAIMLFAGFAVSKGELTLVGIVVAGVLGNLVGSWVGYAIGYFGRARPARAQPALPRQPGAACAQVEGWFERNGVGHRLLLPDAAAGPHLRLGSRPASPGCRSGRFSLLHRRSAASPGSWRSPCSARASAQNWESWRHNLAYLDYVIAAAIVIGAV